jgi:hypothetical protein
MFSASCDWSLAMLSYAFTISFSKIPELHFALVVTDCASQQATKIFQHTTIAQDTFILWAMQCVFIPLLKF